MSEEKGYYYEGEYYIKGLSKELKKFEELRKLSEKRLKYYAKKLWG